MKQLSHFYESSDNVVLHEISNAIGEISRNQQDPILVVGGNFSYIESMKVENVIYAAITEEHISHWPKIRPFRTIVTDVNAMPFLSQSFNTIVIIHFIEFNTQQNQPLIDEIKRILKNGGTLMLIIINKYAKFLQTNKIFTAVKQSPGDVISFLDKNAFDIHNIFGKNPKHNFWPYNFNYQMNKQADFIINLFPTLSEIVVIVAEKKHFASQPLTELNTQINII